MKKLKVTILLIAVLLFVTNCKSTQEISKNPIQASDYIFSGTLVQQSASTMPKYVKNVNSSIAKVDDVLKSSAGHENFKGEEITLVFADQMKNELKEGTSGIFYTNTWLFGSSLAVIVNDIERDKTKIEQIKKEILETQQKQEADQLESRVKLADLIVFGKIGKIEVIDQKRNLNETEHDPDYQLAFVEASEILKGSGDTNSIGFYFASSDDIRWYKSPKFQDGKEGIFLLKRVSQINDIKEPYVLINPLDFQESSKLDEIKNALK